MGKTATSYFSFSLISGILTLLFVAVLIPFIFLAIFLNLDSDIMIAVLVVSSLIFLGVLIFAHRLTWKPVNEFRAQTFPDAPSLTDQWVFIIIVMVFVILVVGAALGFHTLAP